MSTDSDDGLGTLGTIISFGGWIWIGVGSIFILSQLACSGLLYSTGPSVPGGSPGAATASTAASFLPFVISLFFGGFSILGGWLIKTYAGSIENIIMGLIGQAGSAARGEE